MKKVYFGQPHIRLEIAASTNTYARQLIEGGRPAGGTVITSAFQYSGRGQGSHQWESEAGKNLLCSYIFYPEIPLTHLFFLNKMIACSVHQCLESLAGNKTFKIKWPNDIMSGNRKIAGILVETGIKGDGIIHCIAGIGINVNQDVFRTFIPEAVSVKMLTGKQTDLELVFGELNNALTYWYQKLTEIPETVFNYYQTQLFRLGQPHEFVIHGNRMTATVSGADNQGHLLLQAENHEILKMKHGQVQYLFD